MIYDFLHLSLTLQNNSCSFELYEHAIYVSHKRLINMLDVPLKFNGETDLNVRL